MWKKKELRWIDMVVRPEPDKCYITFSRGKKDVRLYKVSLATASWFGNLIAKLAINREVLVVPHGLGWTAYPMR